MKGLGEPITFEEEFLRWLAGVPLLERRHPCPSEKGVIGRTRGESTRILILSNPVC